MADNMKNILLIIFFYLDLLPFLCGGKLNIGIETLYAQNMENKKTHQCPDEDGTTFLSSLPCNMISVTTVLRFKSRNLSS